MSQVRQTKPVAAAAPPFSSTQLLPWLIFAARVPGRLVLPVFEQGSAALFSGSRVHEWMHDGRHLLGTPCH